MPFSFEPVSIIESFSDSHEISDTGDYTFVVQRDGLTLHLTTIPGFGDIFVSIYRDGVDFPIFDSQYEDCHYLKGIYFPNGSRAIQIGLKSEDTSKSADHGEAIQIFIHPHLGVRQITK